MKIGALCAGYGGLEMGLTAVIPGEVAWLAEYDKHASKILDTRYPGVPNHHDITTIDWAELEPVDWLTAGYPCQPFSHAGQRKGTADARHIWPHVAAAVRVLRPRHVLLENVRGHLSLGFGRVLADLADLGYDTRWVCLRAADVEAPHGRARIFIVATDAGGERHGRGEDPGGVGRVEPDHHQGRFREGADHESRTLTVDRSPTATTDTYDGGSRALGTGQDRRTGPDDIVRAGSVADAARDGWEQGWPEPARLLRGPHAPLSGDVDWGIYTAAIRRWERLTRPTPLPWEPGRNGLRLAPAFVEWLMGLPAGWVTDVDIPRNAQLKALGNGVVPQQAAAAVRFLLEQEIR